MRSAPSRIESICGFSRGTDDPHLIEPERRGPLAMVRPVTLDNAFEHGVSGERGVEDECEAGSLCRRQAFCFLLHGSPHTGSGILWWNFPLDVPGDSQLSPEGLLSASDLQVTNPTIDIELAINIPIIHEPKGVAAIPVVDEAFHEDTGNPERVFLVLRTGASHL